MNPPLSKRWYVVRSKWGRNEDDQREPAKSWCFPKIIRFFGVNERMWRKYRADHSLYESWRRFQNVWCINVCIPSSIVPLYPTKPFFTFWCQELAKDMYWFLNQGTGTYVVSNCQKRKSSFVRQVWKFFEESSAHFWICRA